MPPPPSVQPPLGGLPPPPVPPSQPTQPPADSRLTGIMVDAPAAKRRRKRRGEAEIRREAVSKWLTDKTKQVTKRVNDDLKKMRQEEARQAKIQKKRQ